MNVREALDNIYKEFEKTYEEARSEGYNEGFENGNIIDGTFDEKIKEAYENGANDAWRLAKDLTYSIKYEYLKRLEIFGNTDVENILCLSGAQALADLKKYEEEQKEPVFKIGDRVETLVAKDSLGTEIFPVGTIGEVVGISGNSIAVKADVATGCYGYYHADALELANDVILVGDEVYLLDANYHGVITAVWEVGGVVKTERLTQSGKLACDDAKDLHRTGRRFPEIAEVLKQMQEGEE